MDTPLAIITYITASAVIAILLLVAAPTILLDYGLAIAWACLSILTTWIGIESLHADFEDEQEDRRQALLAHRARIHVETVMAFMVLGNACRQTSADIKGFSAAWDRARRAALSGEDIHAN